MRSISDGCCRRRPRQSALDIAIAIASTDEFNENRLWNVEAWSTQAPFAPTTKEGLQRHSIDVDLEVGSGLSAVTQLCRL